MAERKKRETFSNVPSADLQQRLNTTVPHNMPLYLASVWQCESTTQADQLLAGDLDGYVYQRDCHPNADLFAEACQDLHQAERAVITSSGMAAISLAVLSQLQAGDHILVSNQLYGRTTLLLTSELQRLGVTHSLIDPYDLESVRSAVTTETKMMVVETIANPLLRVIDIRGLAKIARAADALLLVDNTFATPAICKPLTLGADLVMESVSKFINGHGDVMLGMLAGNKEHWNRVEMVNAAWGFASSPLECWLACRGVSTLTLRMHQASATAQAAAELLAGLEAVELVEYPGLENHIDHELARDQFIQGFGHMVTFRLAGGREATDRLIATEEIPFCPSLGDVSTTLSHPASTSHRGLSESQRAALGITDGTIRLSIGVDPTEEVLGSLSKAVKRAVE
ncbi:MAG: hypothetical protein CMJ76_05095 [Planctomycetaceae bacterium]|nr:hypothetical protein [Planctomycetaceae bacterium]|tara:strand:+ start:3404 stop:4597 length:1194 start_codon:yes stop_codon:yes gene_type:complete